MRILKNWSYQKVLAKRLKAMTSQKSVEINQGKYIGIIYNQTALQDEAIVKKHKLDLKYQGRIVKTMGFVDDKTESKNLNDRAFTQLDINWNNVPESPLIEAFQSRSYDLLLCPITQPHPALDFLIQTTNARFKIGTQYPDSEKLYNLIIDPGANSDLKYILDQFFNQLNLISL